VQSALTAVWGVTRYLGGETPKENPGPGDKYEEIKPLTLPD
jgi:tryptophan 2-monooxygenase